MKQKNIRGRIEAVIILVVVLLLTFLFTYTINNYGYAEDSERFILSTGWKVTVSDKRYEDVNLSNFSFPVLGSKDSVTLQTIIPENIPRNSSLRLLTYLSMIHVYVDGEEIYEYGEDYYERGQLVGSGYHFINLPPKCAGKNLYIIIDPRENDAFTSITPPQIVSSNHAYQMFVSENKLSLYIGLFLFVFGLIVTVISAVAAFYNEEYVRLVWIGVFSFLIGIWTMCNSKVFQIFSAELSLNTQLEYLTLFFAPTPFCMMLLDTRNRIALWRKNVIRVCMAIVFGFSSVTFLLQITNTVHYPSMVGLFHLIATIGMCTCIIMTCSNLAGLRLYEKVFYLGMGVLCVFVAADLIRFNMQKYFMHSSEKFTVSILPLGTFFFVLLMIISYVISLYDNVLTKAQEQSLQRIAYRDALTGVYNRAKCEELFLELDASEEDFALISFDMNGLKVTNDTYGHTKGDRMLTSFAQLLEQVFGKHGYVMRVGGDEFLVLLRHKELGNLEKLIKRYKKQLMVYACCTDIELSASYGVCRRSECEDGTVKEVYKRVDARMYEMKNREKGRQ